MKSTILVLAWAGASLILWDIALATDPVPGNTISGALNETSRWTGGAAGYLAGHLFRPTIPPEEHPPIWVKATGGILSLGLGLLFGSGWAGFLSGLALGYFIWPNSGKAGP